MLLRSSILLLISILILTGCAIQLPIIHSIIQPVFFVTSNFHLKVLFISRFMNSSDFNLHLLRSKNSYWNVSAQLLIEDMLKSIDVMPGGKLLVDQIKNSTNERLRKDKAMKAINEELSKYNMLTLISDSQLNQAKKMLGLSPHDELRSRSKAIGLARIVGAAYVLYSNIYGDIKYPMLKMQLIFVKTGEIIWSNNVVIIIET